MPDKKEVVLIVDDKQMNLDVLSEILSPGYTVITADSGEQALYLVEGFYPDLILMDVNMPPGMDGFETCALIKSNPVTSDIPIIFLTAVDNIKDKLHGLKVGGSDYITKPFYSEEVLARVKLHVKLAKTLEEHKRLSRELEFKLNERTQQLINTERHAAFSLLIQGIIHNLKSPLTALSGNSELISYILDKNKESDPTFLKFKKQIQQYNERNLEACIRLQEMIENMMCKSRNSESDINDNVDLNTLVQTEIEFMNSDPFFKHDITKEILLCDKILLISIKKGEFSQVFSNLLRNSMEAMNNTKDPVIKIVSYEEDEYAVLKIIDNGPGIPGKYLKNIFDPFFTTKKNNSENPTIGTGLGLYTCKKIMTDNFGFIEVDSEEGRTEFILSFPLSNSNSEE
ncbi:MAG: hybrid sensor histidine kinase/response regulator [Candidatus Delongbacteria bacterium]|nr:hybrid sensor histidine kinase/response regulator [Candidatus Delongbacteria bacterium]MBN2834431.1 hybrid sensor histidine kinase/response regulator [Candidatus Delongbacteria bacterium]